MKNSNEWKRRSRAWNILAICCALMAALSAGAAAHAADAAGSRLVGLLITAEDLAASVGGDGVLWATEARGASDTEYVFDSVKGIRFICFMTQDEEGGNSVVTNADPEISSAGFDFENEASVRMEGILYVVPGWDERSFFYNPVLRMEDGRVCAVPGDPMYVSAGMNPPGSSVGQTLKDERTHMENGAEITDVTVVSLEIRAVRKPLQTILLQFSDTHELLNTEAYAPGAVPEEITMLPGADYLLSETREADADGTVFTRREVFGREDDFLTTLSCREDGICIQRFHEVVWGTEQ